MACEVLKILYFIIMPPARRRILPASSTPISPGSSATTPMERNMSVILSPVQRTTRTSRRVSPSTSGVQEREFIRLQDVERHSKHKETLLKEQVKYKKKIIRSLVYTNKTMQSKLQLLEAAVQIEKDELRDRSNSVLDLLRHYKLNYSNTTSFLSLWSNKCWEMIGELEKLG
jgi:hypothetical protein